MGAEHAGVCVQFVQHDELQPGEKLGPSPVLGHYRGMQHIWIGEDHRRAAAEFATKRRGGVAVVNAGQHAVGSGGVQCPVERLELVLTQRLGRKHQHRFGAGVVRQRFYQRYLVAETLSRRGARCDHHVLPAAQDVYGGGLVVIELIDTACGEHLFDRVAERLFGLSVGGLATSDLMGVYDLVGVGPAGANLV